MKKINIKETTLAECLKWSEVQKLPDVDDGENLWIKAIALVAKSDGSKNYVVLGKDKDLKNKVIKDFGNSSIIKEIKEIYPYSYLSAAYVPEFKTKKKDERIAWLQRHYPNEKLDEKTLKELDKMVLVVAIKSQIQKRTH